jgi:hypothetical protein
MFNPLVKKDMLKAHPRLGEIVGEREVAHLDLILRYVCIMYDPKSPVIIQEKDLNYRKQVSAELAGFNQPDDEEFLQELFAAKIDWATVIIMRFLMRFVRERKWALICALEFKYWEGVARIMKPVEKGLGGKDWDELKSIQIKATIADEAVKDIARLDTLYKEFYGEDSELENAARNHRMTPETIGKFAQVEN